MRRFFSRLKELLLHNRSTKQIIAKNVFWLSFGQIGSRLFRALFIIYAARVLGTETYGVFSYALSLAGFFTIFADIGINALLTREAAQKAERDKEYFATSFVIKAALLLGTAALVVFVAPYFSKIEAARALVPLIAFLVIFDNIRELCNSFFRAKDRMEREAFVTIITNVAITICGFIILAFSKTAFAVTLTYIASAGIGTLAAIILLRRIFINIPRLFDKTLVRPILRAAWPILLTGLLGAFMINMDIIMLGRMRPPGDIGLYAAGQRIVQLLYVLSAIFTSALFPTLSRLAGNHEVEREKSILEKSISIVFAAILPITVGGIVLGKPIMALLYGSDYLPGTLAFQILMATLLVVFLGTLLGNLLVAHNQQKKAAFPVTVASLGNVIGNALLIPPFGIAGAAAATVIAQTLLTTLIWRIAKKKSPFRTFHRLLKIALATVLMGIFTAILETFHVPVLVNIPLAGLFYFAILFITKEPLAEEMRTIFLKTLRVPSQ